MSRSVEKCIETTRVVKCKCGATAELTGEHSRLPDGWQFITSRLAATADGTTVAICSPKCLVDYAVKAVEVNTRREAAMRRAEAERGTEPLT